VALGHLARRPLRLLLVSAMAGFFLAAGDLAIVARMQAPATATAFARPRAVVSVLMPVGAGAPEAAHVREVIQRTDGVESLRFLAREAALAELARRPALSGLHVDGLAVNPLPDAWVVTFEAAVAADRIEAAASAWSKDAWVGSVEYDPAPWRRWLALAGLVRALLVVFALPLALAAFVALAACVLAGPWPQAGQTRLLLELGAAPRALRRPFVYAAACSALLAGLVAWGITALAWRALGPLVARFVAEFGLASPFVEVPAWVGIAGALSFAAVSAAIASLVHRIRETG
jgi:cell division transport system permease protein